MTPTLPSNHPTPQLRGRQHRPSRPNTPTLAVVFLVAFALGACAGMIFVLEVWG